MFYGGERTLLRLAHRRVFMQSVLLTVREASDWLRDHALPQYSFAIELLGEGPGWGVGQDVSSGWIASRSLADLLAFQIGLHTVNTPEGEPSGGMLEIEWKSLDPLRLQILRLWSKNADHPPRVLPLSRTVPLPFRREVFLRLKVLDHMLCMWGERFGLNEPWVLREALATVRYWNAGREISWVHERPGTGPEQAPPAGEEWQWVPFWIPTWDAWHGESRADAQRRMESECKRLISEHLEKLEESHRALAKDRGKRGRDLIDPLTRKDFMWLAAYRCGRMPQKEIAEMWGIEQGTVSKRIAKATRAVGLRPVKRKGRPPKAVT